jgi:hypothetical protein
MTMFTITLCLFMTGILISFGTALLLEARRL